MEEKLPGGMLALLIEALGGKEKAEEAMAAIVRTKCRTAIRQPGATIGAVYDLAVKEGWLAEFLSLSIADFTETPGTPAKLTKRKSRRRAICAYVGAHPGALAGDIREAVGGTVSTIGSTLTRMHRKGLLVARGARPIMTYYLPADAPKLA